MSGNPIFYQSVMPVSEQRHAGFFVQQGSDCSFSKATNAVFLSVIEFAKASHYYPIVFSGDDNSLSPVALLGFEKEQNLFIKGRSTWDADYLPAYVRRYPFILANAGSEFTVCIDEAYEGVNQDGRGERLFEEDGSQSAYLQRMVGFLQQYQVESQRSQAFSNHLKELDLLEPMHANVELNSGAKMSLTGFYTVNRDRLKNLDAEVIGKLAKNDELEWIYIHLASLDNFNSLMERFAATDAGS
ncbi:MAG: SapC family protein [gamma proteobacterium endosymbiont of Lamellibrachia anaximandri]|nr:SapC family protein [gamma proteobacterium endosymbiont of Lamellibrachia anaximandri]